MGYPLEPSKHDIHKCIYTCIFTPGHPEILDQRSKRQEPKAIPNWVAGVGQQGKVTLNTFRNVSLDEKCCLYLQLCSAPCCVEWELKNEMFKCHPLLSILGDAPAEQ